jgi:hypothetical protein
MKSPAPTASPCSQRLVARCRLNRVREGVPEVQHGALTVLELVAADDLCLDLA